MRGDANSVPCDPGHILRVSISAEFHDVTFYQSGAIQLSYNGVMIAATVYSGSALRVVCGVT